MIGTFNALETQRHDESAGVVATMIARLPIDIQCDETAVAKALLRDGWTAGFIADNLDAVMKNLERRAAHRAAVEAGGATLAGYVKTYGDAK